MPAGKFNFTIEQGTDLTLPMVVKNCNDTPYDLTDFTAKMQIRECVDSAIAIDTLTTENNRIVIEEVNVDGVMFWRVVLGFPNAVTSLYEFSKAYYDLELISDDDLVTRFLEGEISLSKEITK